MDKPKLTSAEMGKLWGTYIGNTMSVCVLSYYIKCVKDTEIKDVLNQALTLSRSFNNTIKEIFEKDNFPIPVGFSDEDVNLDAPVLFEDTFYLHYLKYLGKAGMSVYSVAVPLVSREDVRNFFTNALNENVRLMNTVNLLQMKKGIFIYPPSIPTPDKVDFVNKQSYLSGYFGNVRTLHGLEIAHLYDNLENDLASKALIIGFSQVAKEKEIKKYFIRGKELNQKHIEMCSQKLEKDNLPAPSLIDQLVTTSTTAPFSDKLMVYHKIDMFSMKIRAYANGASLSGRRDIGIMYARLIADVSLFVEDGGNILIDRGWFEQPPAAVDRDGLSK